MKRVLVVLAVLVIVLALLGLIVALGLYGSRVRSGLTGVVWQGQGETLGRKLDLTLQFFEDGHYVAVIKPYYGNSGTYIQLGSHLKMELLVSNLTFLGPDAPQERMTQTSTFTISDGTLTLYDASGNTLFLFVSGGPPTPCYDCPYTPSP